MTAAQERAGKTRWRNLHKTEPFTRSTTVWASLPTTRDLWSRVLRTTMGIRHLLLLLMYLDPLSVLGAATGGKKNKPSPKKVPTPAPTLKTPPPAPTSNPRHLPELLRRERAVWQDVRVQQHEPPLLLRDVLPALLLRVQEGQAGPESLQELPQARVGADGQTFPHPDRRDVWSQHGSDQHGGVHHLWDHSLHHSVGSVSQSCLWQSYRAASGNEYTQVRGLFKKNKHIFIN